MSLPSDTFLPPHYCPSKRFVFHEGKTHLASLLTSNYSTWLGGLKLYLKNIEKEYVLTMPLAEITEATPLAEMYAYFNHIDDSFKVRRLMMISIPTEFQEMFKDDGVFEIYRKLSEMFADCLSQHNLDFMDNPNDGECIQCARWAI